MNELKALLADRYASSQLTRNQVATGVVILDGRIYEIDAKTDLDILTLNFTLHDITD